MKKSFRQKRYFEILLAVVLFLHATKGISQNWVHFIGNYDWEQKSGSHHTIYNFEASFSKMILKAFN